MYVVRAGGAIKIGVTCNLERRRRALATGSAVPRAERRLPMRPGGTWCRAEGMIGPGMGNLQARARQRRADAPAVMNVGGEPVNVPDRGAGGSIVEEPRSTLPRVYPAAIGRAVVLFRRGELLHRFRNRK